jgi:3-phenylpropionate/trans-cinnamate dioxygenase ferredoxin reductase subunit
MIRAVQQIVIIGGGLAGTGAAGSLREENFTGRIVLISSDAAPPYDHVPLSKNYLRGEPGHHQLFLHDESFYRQRSIDLRLGTTVTAIDTARHRVRLDSGEHVGYDKLLIATGSSNRKLRVPGNDLGGIFYLRTLADADRLKSALAHAGTMIVVGAGFVGCEVAASARQMGLDVTLIGREPRPMLKALGPIGAGFYADLHRAHGVHLHMGVGLSHFTGHDGEVHGAVLDDGTELPADLIVVGVGAEPAVGVAAAAGIPVDRGIITDEALATGVSDVYAAGDVASVPSALFADRPGGGHFAAALSQGPVAALSMLGQQARYEAMPFFFSDQYDVWMEFTGHAVADADIVTRGDVAGGQFVVFWLRGESLVAAMNVNVLGVPDIVTPLIAGGRSVDRAALADPTVDLGSLVDE